MGAIDWVCLALGVNKAHFIPGLVGGVFSLKWVPEVNWWGRVTAVLFGGLIASWWTKPVYSFFHVVDLPIEAIAMGIGLLALSTASAVFKGLQEARLGEVIAERLRKLLGATGPPSSGDGGA